MINLDANATYGVSSEHLACVSDQVLGALNPSSIHQGGQKARALLEEARERILALCGATNVHQLVFTSGATESNNLLFWSVLQDFKPKCNVILSAVEHPSVREVALFWRGKGVTVTEVPPRVDGEFHPSDFESHVTSETKLVSVMFANNETGQVLPLKDIARAVRAKNPHVVIHTDAVQGLGKTDLSLATLPVDAMSVSGHKIGGVAGAGALIFQRDIPFVSLLKGGPQELRHRAGTENLFGSVSFGLMAQEVMQEEGRIVRMKNCRDALEAFLTEKLPGIKVFHPQSRLPNTLSVHIPNAPADDLVVAADLQGLSISSGSACASGKPEPSHVLLAMGHSSQESKETIRISLRADSTKVELDKAGAILVACVRRIWDQTRRAA